MYGNLNKLAKFAEANTIALWIIKVSEKFNISSLINALDTLKKDIRNYYVKVINENNRKNNIPSVAINKSDLENKMEKDLSRIKYSNEGLCGVVQGIYVEISDEEFKRVAQNTQTLNISEIGNIFFSIFLFYFYFYFYFDLF